ncbi:MAG: glycine--tRNA ligase subunit beta, partial [Mangrovicoccus sp.]|nr:glycine--tRNA ligase subunit beta [Mangrovicoccus sp.]
VSDEAGSEVVPVEIGPVAAGRTTRGHRFMAPDAITVTSFDDYAARLKRAKVLLDPAERAEQIRHDAGNLAFAQGLEVVEDAGLLAEVSGLVEWPVALMGEIEPRFRHLPAEVLQTSMRTHQKFFAVRDGSGAITHFITVANRETADHGATILAGNRKVLAARLSDAAFFWDRDLAEAKAGMATWLDGLGAVTFHARLGSQKDRILRIAALARDLAPAVGADPDLAEQAARVAKADLRSEMVGEFPELQGIMGRYYALEAGMPAAVADACAEHYSPLGPSDAVPTAPVSVAVALADKIDILTGFWAIDEKPTGSKDPFALRRAALGVIRLVLETGLRLPLDRLFDVQVLRHQVRELADLEAAERFTAILDASLRTGMYSDETRGLVAQAAEAAPSWHARLDPHDPAISDDLLAFFHDRLKVFLRDQGIRHDVIDAVIALPGKCDLALIVRRAEALSAFLGSDDGANLLQGFKRANNILTQAEAADGVEYSFGPDAKLARSDAERALFAALEREGRAISSAIETEDFASAMRGMASLRAPIDGFFEAEQVNAENQVIRRNRLNLMHLIRATCLKVADLTRLQG